MSFPSDIKVCMRECILTLLWPRKDIVAFFVDHGCTKADMQPVANFEADQLSRLKIVDHVFGQLSARADGGLGQFRSMLQALLNWSSFDAYYFDTLHKLDRHTAGERIEHPRQLQEIRDARIQQERERREIARMAAQKSGRTIPELREEFLNLYNGSDSPQARGYKFEKILIDLAKSSKLETTDSFRVSGEQIDGALKYDGEHYLFEAKWQDKAASNEPLYQFAAKVEGKMYGRGIFVSVHGFSDAVVSSLTVGKAIKTVLVDGEDIVLVLEEHLTMAEMIDAKIKAAQTRGLIYVHPIRGSNKHDAISHL